MASRALAEMCGYFVLAAGHGLGNLTMRTLALSSDACRVLARRRPDADGFPPFSDKQQAWPALTPTLAAQAVEAAEATPFAAVADLCRVLVTLTRDSRWLVLEQRRHDDYHRWRPQSLPTGGVPTRSLWTRPSPGVMQLSGAVHFFEGLNVDQLTDSAGDALEALADAMLEWDALWPVALKALGYAVLKVDDDAGPPC
jgi:hypothetical protein